MRLKKIVKFLIISVLASVILGTYADSVDIREFTPEAEWHLSPYWTHSRNDNLWKELSYHFTLNHYVRNNTVQREIHQYLSQRDYLKKITDNARPYLFYIYSQTRQHQMPAEIALVPMIESDYNPLGVSNRGAIGLWQMMPGTASGLGIKINAHYDGRRNVIRSTDAALKHLSYLYHYFGNWLLALAAYNAGDGTVRAAIRYNQKHHLPTDFWHLHLPKQTQIYVPKLLALATLIANNHKYGFQLKDIPNQPYFDGIKLKEPMQMSTVAKLAHTDLKTIQHLNPAFRHWNTTPSDSYWLLLPAKNAEQLQLALVQRNQNSNHKENPTKTTSSIDKYRVKQGDSLNKLAHHFHTTTSAIKSKNHLTSNIILIGQRLVIPSIIKVEKHKEEKLPGPTRIQHKVAANETLSGIAHHYQVKESEIRYWNHLSYHDKLKAGEELILWKNKKAVTKHTPPKLKKKKLVHYKKQIHRVAPGESLNHIASEYHVNPYSIVRWNHLENRKRLEIGESLTIYTR